MRIVRSKMEAIAQSFEKRIVVNLSGIFTTLSHFWWTSVSQNQWTLLVTEGSGNIWDVTKVRCGKGIHVTNEDGKYI